jgi:phosphoglycerate kinase
MNKKSLEDVVLTGKRVLVRVDFNVPMKNGVITDDNRIVQALPTIQYIIEEKGKAILFSHLGRVETAEDKAKSSLAPVAARLAELLGKPVTFIPETRGEALEKAIDEMKFGDVVMFENTRFEDIEGKKESKNNPELGLYWASLGDLLVNDAFGTAHRAHASNVGIATHLPAVAGYLMEKELRYIGSAVDNPVRPFVAILGGAKVSDKIGVIENLLAKADKVLIGGGMAYTFMKALGLPIGKSICELDKIDLATDLLKKANGKIILPVDVVVTKEFKNDTPFRTTDYKGIKDDEEGLDVGPKTIELFKKELKGAKTVIWNGPLGVFEFENFAKGTKAICEILAGMKDAKTIIGGGDSAAAAIQMGYADKFTHISTGGGASLEYLEGKALPGVESLDDAEGCGCGCGCGCDD